MEFIAGLSLGLSVGAFVLSAWTFVQRRYTAEDVQGRVNQAFYAGQAASMGGAAISPSVPVNPPKADFDFSELEEEGKESIGGFDDGGQYGVEEFLKYAQDGFKKELGDFPPIQGVSIR